MNPKEKAKDIFVKMYELIPDYVITENKIASELAKQCALIAVSDILNIAYWEYMESFSAEEQKFWEDVKQEIEKL